MRISDWSSDVCSSDLSRAVSRKPGRIRRSGTWRRSSSGGAFGRVGAVVGTHRGTGGANDLAGGERLQDAVDLDDFEGVGPDNEARGDVVRRSEEHTSELQSLMRISYAVFCLKKKTKIKQ